MLAYSVVMFITAAIFAGVSIAIYKGKTGLIHDYHQTKVTDKPAYGRAFGKAMLVFPTAMLLSGALGLLEHFAAFAVTVLIIGLCIGIRCIAAVQRTYNKGVF